MASRSRILVTGGAGFIGSNFILMMRRIRPEVTIINLDALTYAGNLENLDGLRNDPGYVFERGSICDRVRVRSVMAGCEAVINFAAESHVDRSIADSGPFVETNIRGTQVLLDVARELGVTRFLQVSTDEVYGSLPLDRPDLRFTEESPLVPSSPYAASKAAADLLCQSYGRTFGLPVAITRCSNNFGPFQFPEKVIPLFVINLLAGKPVPLYGDGLNVRDWIHVEDHCEAILAVLERGRFAGDVYNVGADNEHANIDLTRMLLGLLGRDETFIRRVPDRPGHDRRYAISSIKIRDTLGWRPSRSAWPAALAATVDWYREHEPWWRRVMDGQYRAWIDAQYGDAGCGSAEGATATKAPG